MVQTFEETNATYRGILILSERLTRAGIPHQLDLIYDGWRLAYPVFFPREKCVCIVSQHSYCRFAKYADLDIVGLVAEDEETWGEYSARDHLTFEDVFERIKAHWRINHDCLS